MKILGVEKPRVTHILNSRSWKRYAFLKIMASLFGNFSVVLHFGLTPSEQKGKFWFGGISHVPEELKDEENKSWILCWGQYQISSGKPKRGFIGYFRRNKTFALQLL